jgi:hypothetical protein
VLDVPPARHVERGHALAEQRAHMVLVAPQDGRHRTGRSRLRVAPEELKELRGDPVGCEVDHADRAPGPAHPQQLVGHRLVVGSEHGAHRRGDDVEFPVAERQRLRVGLDPLELEPAGTGLAAACVEARGRQVGRDHVRSCLCRADGDVARAGGDVEHPLAGRHAARCDQLTPEAPDGRGGEPVVVAERPHRAVGGLERVAGVDRCCAAGASVDTHAVPPFHSIGPDGGLLPARDLVDPGEGGRLGDHAPR